MCRCASESRIFALSKRSIRENDTKKSQKLPHRTKSLRSELTATINLYETMTILELSRRIKSRTSS